jgi:collagenase-like PrtC family protease
VTDVTLSLGPLLYLWEPEAWRDFYFRIADEAPVEAVTVGEVVCSKRMHFMAPHLDEVIERLERAGKTVRLGSLALVTLPREEKLTQALAEQARVVEVNDLSALAALKGKPCTIGPLVNVYNAATAKVLHARGASTICLPPELTFESVREIVSGAPEVRFEVFAFGRVPLALSARCAHARLKGNTKDNCQFVCGEDPDGLTVETLDGQPFLALNGIQTVSHTCQALVGELTALSAAGVSAFRLSPQRCDMVAVAELYRAVLDGRVDGEEGVARLGELYPAAPLANGFLFAAPGAELIRQQLGSAAQTA